MRLHEPTAGHAYFWGQDLFGMGARELRSARREIQMIFQDPYTSLNPRMTVGEIIAESWRIHTGIVPRKNQRERVGELLDVVGLNPDHINRYPHQFSGGQRQRIGVARAIALEPSVIICDEPVSALDVSVQAQVINLLLELQERLALTVLFVAHDLRLVRHISHRVAVMYLGRIVELDQTERLFTAPRHPYTRALLSAAPELDPSKRSRTAAVRGELPSPVSIPPGCPFHPRCAYAFDRCSQERPALEARPDGSLAACHLASLPAEAR
jgi:oligopeptide/dipeptide ABC transporter ATP-binding protein